MATNVTFKNSSQLNSIRVMYENYIPAIAAKAAEKGQPAVAAVPARWEKLREEFYLPGTAGAVWLGAANRRVTFEEVPT